MRLAALVTLGKLSGEADFAVERCFGPVLDPDRLLVAGDWLQAHIMAANEQLLALTRSNDDVWLIRGVREPGTDNSGRQLHRLWLGWLLPGLPEADPVNIIRTLFGCYQGRMPPVGPEVEAQELPEAQMEPLFDESAMNAAGLLLATDESFATVPAVEPALAVIQLIGLAAFDHVVMSRRCVPPVLPSGRALVISASGNVPNRPQHSTLAAQVKALRAFDLGRLASITPSTARRAMLMRAATDPGPFILDDASDEELDWLLAIPHCRTGALLAASCQQLERLAENGALRVEESGAVASRLTAAGRAAMVRQLAGRPGGLDQFVAWFGRGAEGVEALLPADAAAAWAHLDTAASRPFAALFERVGLLERLDGDLPFFARLAQAWFGAVDDAILLQLLARAGGGAPVALLALLTGAPPPSDAAALADDLPTLLHADVIGSDRIVDAVLHGWPLALLSACHFSEESIVLVTDQDLPPRAAPAGWDVVLLPLLRRGVREAWFWRRWRDGVPPVLVEWLHEVLEPWPEGNVTASLLAAMAESRALTQDELLLVLPALGPETVARQSLLWARNDCVGREVALNLLLAAPCLTSELAGWLRGELMSSMPSAPPPELSAALMTALLPVLHPQRDVIRRILARPDIEPDEDRLLAGLMRVLTRTGFGLPLPRPEAADCRRRPQWTATLSRLPGWEHWRQTEEEMP